MDRVKFELSRDQKSDHIVLAEAIRLWENADSKGQGASFCWNNFLSANTLSMLKCVDKCFLVIKILMQIFRRMKTQLAEHLQKMKFVSTADPKDPEFNVHSNNYALVKAVVSAGLYPNIAVLK